MNFRFLRKVDISCLVQAVDVWYKFLGSSHANDAPRLGEPQIREVSIVCLC